MNSNNNLSKTKNKFFYYLEILKERFPLNLNLKKGRKSNIIVRVDDFPHWIKKNRKFVKFDQIMKKYNIHYILGVTPYLSLSPHNPDCQKYRKLTKNEIKILKEGIKENRITLAIHGLTHKTTSLKEYSEYKYKSNSEIEKEIKFGFKLFKEYGLPKPKILIPPYNSFSPKNLNIFKKYFEYITGGPETIKEFGKINILKGIKYIPSYYPNYIKKNTICKYSPKSGLNCITIHWMWFNSKEIEQLCAKISKYNLSKKNAFKILNINE